MRSENTTPQRRQAYYGVSLRDLFDKGLVSPVERTSASRSGVDYKAEVLSDDRLRTDDRAEFDTLQERPMSTMAAISGA